MEKQTVSFAVVTENGVVTRIGKTQISTPQIKFCGGTVKWYEDRPKKRTE